MAPTLQPPRLQVHKQHKVAGAVVTLQYKVAKLIRTTIKFIKIRPATHTLKES
jgi:hypothetical protein